MFETLSILFLAAQAASAHTTNSTQLGAINDGNNLYCIPTRWYDVFVFFLGNYISHALTIKSYPGEATTSVLIAAFGALLIPTTGLIRGINAIARNAKFKHKNFLRTIFRDPDYQTAAAAGALCMVVRKKSWKPYPGDKVSNVVLREESQATSYSKWTMRHRIWMKGWGVPLWFEVQPIARKKDAPEPDRTLKVYRGPWTEERGRYWGYTDTSEQYVHPSKTVHGLYDFKDQAWSYALAHVPRDAVVSTMADLTDLTPRRLEATGTGMSSRSSKPVGAEDLSSILSSPVIAASYSIPKAVIAIVQLSYAIVTLYQSRGTQIEHYGYAAFALTVIPYAIMSLINLVGNLLTPDYQALYLVASDVMDEAIRRGAQFDGVVGRLVEVVDVEPATIEVLSHNKDENGSDIKFSYGDKNTTTSFPVSVVDYSSPPLPHFKRRRYMKEHVEATSKDLSASIFIPSCSKFRRQTPHIYPTNTNRTQMTPQGAFSFTSMRPTNDWRFFTCLVFAAIILGIIGGVTHFRSGEASVSQAGWILHWYIFGAVYSGFALADGVQSKPWPEPDMGQPSKHDVWLMLIPCVLYGIPAIGGFVTVIQMLFQWGTCTFY